MAEQKLDIQPIEQQLDIQPLDIQPINTGLSTQTRLKEPEQGNSLWNFIQHTAPVQKLNQFLTGHIDELAEKKPGILNPNPEQNPLINKPLLPETKDEGGIFGTARHWGYENIIRPMSSPLGILGTVLDANPPTEPIGLPKLSVSQQVDQIKASAPKLKDISVNPEVAETLFAPKISAQEFDIKTNNLNRLRNRARDGKLTGTELEEAKLLDKKLRGMNFERPSEESIPEFTTPKKTAETLFGPAYADNKVANNIAKTVDKVHSPELDLALADPTFVKKFIPPTPTRTTPLSRVAANVGSAVETEIDKQNPILGETVKRARADFHQQDGTWRNQFDDIVKDIPRSEQSKLVDAVEGTVQLDPVKDKAIIEALPRYKALDREIFDSKLNVGIDTTPIDNHWPHRYPPEVLEQLKNNPLEVRANMMREGKSPIEIDAILANARQFGEKISDAEHMRESKLPGYRKDFDAYREYITDEAKRVVNAREYGPRDLGDSKSPVVQMIDESRNPLYTAELMKKVLDRDTKGNADWRFLTRGITKYQAWTHLVLSGINNMQTAGNSLFFTSPKAFAQGAFEYMKDRAAAREFADTAGATHNIFREIFKDGIRSGELSPTKLNGMDAGERFMRTLSASVGKARVQELFKELKNNPNNPTALKDFQNLILERPEKVLLQPELTDRQIKRAAFRVSQLSQGMAETQDVPAAWTGSGTANLLTLFHKYQFTSTKNMKDLVMAHPWKTIPLLLGASQVASEITGDTKAAVMGGINELLGNEKGISDTIGERGKFWESRLGVDWMTGRLIENAVQSFMLGTIADVLEMSTGSGSDAIKQLLGSSINDVGKLIDIGHKTAVGIGNQLGLNENDKALGQAGQGALKMIPVVGRPLAEAVK